MSDKAIEMISAQQTFNDLSASICAIEDEATSQNLQGTVRARLFEVAGSMEADS